MNVFHWILAGVFTACFLNALHSHGKPTGDNPNHNAVETFYLSAFVITLNYFKRNKPLTP